MLTSQRSATDEAAEKPSNRILSPKQQQLEETQKITQQLIIIKKLLETSLTPGIDGLTAAQRLLLKQSAETHNRIGEATAAVRENTEGQSKILAALDKNTVALDKFRTYLENWDARTRIHDRAPATPTSPTPPQANDECNKCHAKILLKPDGKKEWVQENGRWMLKNPDSSTHYCGRGQ